MLTSIEEGGGVVIENATFSYKVKSNEANQLSQRWPLPLTNPKQISSLCLGPQGAESDTTVHLSTNTSLHMWFSPPNGRTIYFWTGGGFATCHTEVDAFTCQSKQNASLPATGCGSFSTGSGCNKKEKQWLKVFKIRRGTEFSFLFFFSWFFFSQACATQLIWLKDENWTPVLFTIHSSSSETH